MKAMGLLSRAAPGVFKMMMRKVGAGMSKQQEAALNPVIERFESYWLDEILPEIKQHIAYFESSDLRGMSLDQLRAHLAETLKRVERMGALHGVIMPMLSTEPPRARPGPRGAEMTRPPACSGIRTGR